MCLASRRAPALARRRAIEWGLFIMAGIEIVTVVVAILIYFALSKLSSTPDSGMRPMEYLIEFVPWVSAVTVWLLLLGAWELPLDTLSQRAAGAGGSRAGRR